jgi:hypothetical protein
VNWSSAHERLRLLVAYDSWPASARREEYEHRNLKFEIKGSENQALAMGTFVEWEFNYPPENWVEDNSRAGVPLMNWFVGRADELSQSSYDAAELVYTFWPENHCENPFNFGNVVIFDRLEINAKTKAQSTAVWVLINRLISRQFFERRGKRNRAAIILIKPFPLEYEGKVTNENKHAFERRRAAMIRHYQARLGAKLLDDNSADRWIWMWIDTGCPIKPRKLRRKSVRKSRALHVEA